MLKCKWEALSPNIKNAINEAGFQTFFRDLLDHDTNECKDIQLLLALSEQLWDTTWTFHFLSIDEVMQTPYDFLAIIGLKLGGERVKVNDSISSLEIRGLLGVMPPKVRSKNVPLMWLYSNIDKCKTIATSTRMFMLFFIGTLLCPDLGSTVSLHYLWSLRDIGQIKNYDWAAWLMRPSCTLWLNFLGAFFQA